MKLSKIVAIPLLGLIGFSSYAATQSEKDSTGVNQSTSYVSSKNKKDSVAEDELRHLEFGVRYMPTFSSLDLHTYDGGVVEGSVTMSHGFGIMTALNLTKHIGIQAEVNYYQLNQKYADRTYNNDLTINYLNIPILLSLNTNKESRVNLNIVAGPQFGLNVGSKIERSDSNNQDSLKAVVGIRKGDVGVAYGAGLEFALNSSHTIRLDVGYRGFYGLVNMDTSSPQEGTYNILVHASRKTYGAYVGLAWMF